MLRGPGNPENMQDLLWSKSRSKTNALALDCRTSGELIRIRGVRKSYPGVGDVISDLNMSIQCGEFVTLLGPSGSGKSTILMLLAGFETPDGGSMSARGCDYATVPPKDRNIGVVFQDYALFPHLNVFENVAYPLRTRRVSRGARAGLVADALRLVKLGGFEKRRPFELSGGQRQRVALARALVFKPDLVLMDEPLSALDRQLRDHMQIELKQLHEKLGLTVVFVTHDQAEALTMSDRIVVLNRGRVEQIGTPEDIYDRSANLFVAQFVGESNALDGVVADTSDDLASVYLPCGIVLRCSTTPGLAVDGQVRVLVRPENIRLKREPSTLLGGADPHLSGTVEERIFYGDHARLTVRLTSGDFVVAKVDETLPGQFFDVGELALVDWSPKHARAYPRDFTPTEIEEPTIE